MVKITAKTCAYFDVSEDTVFEAAFKNMLSEIILF